MRTETRPTPRTTDRHLVRTAASTVLVAAALAIIWWTCLEIVPRYDLRVFLRAGADVLAGRNPYPPLDSPFLYSGHAFVYPYAAALPFAPLALLPAGAADVVFFLVSAGAVLWAARLAGATDLRVLLCALAAATTIRSMQVGALNALLMLACVAAWHYRDRAKVAGAVVAAAVVSKLFVVPLLCWLVLARRWRCAATAIGLIGMILGLGWWLGPLSFSEYRTLLEILSHHETQQTFSLNRLALTLGADASLARVVTVAVAAALVGAAWQWYRRTGAEAVLYAACISGALTVSPIVWSHYYVLLLAPLLVARAHWGVFVGFAAMSWFIAPPVDIGPVADVLEAAAGTPERLAAAQILVMGVVAVVAATARPPVPELVEPALLSAAGGSRSGPA